METHFIALLTEGLYAVPFESCISTWKKLLSDTVHTDQSERCNH